IKSRIEKIAPLSPVKLKKQGPARYFNFDGAMGVIGIIAALTCRFCDECNRLRITAGGELKPCLFSNINVPLLKLLREGATSDDVKEALRTGINLKPEGHTLGWHPDYTMAMSRIGG
ncbi:MAG: GTP 3',8-cyclase MoaA, partial [Nitrospirae bacterium]|nr:GTP 3',8-cyclase MoaA [Nitrospirota bacterium]